MVVFVNLCPKALEDFSAFGVDFSDSLFLVEVIYVGGGTGAKRDVLLVHVSCVFVWLLVIEAVTFTMNAKTYALLCCLLLLL